MKLRLKLRLRLRMSRGHRKASESVHGDLMNLQLIRQIFPYLVIKGPPAKSMLTWNL